MENPTAEQLLNQYRVANTGSFFELSDRGVVLVSGDDGATFLNGVLSADFLSISVGCGCYSALLDPKGKYLTDIRAFRVAPGFVLVCPATHSEMLTSMLLKYRFRAKVTIADISAELKIVALFGARSAEALSELEVSLPPAGDFSIVESERPEIRWIARFSETVQEGFWIFAERDKATLVNKALGNAGVVCSSGDIYNLLRIQAGEPVWGVDIDETVIPLEAGQDRACSFTKCYPGQEVVSRIHYRGHVNRYLVRLEIPAGVIPENKAPVWSGGKEVGRITSFACNPETGLWHALGFIRREILLKGAELTVMTGNSSVKVTPSPLPYRAWS